MKTKLNKKDRENFPDADFSLIERMRGRNIFPLILTICLEEKCPKLRKGLELLKKESEVGVQEERTY